MRFYTSMAARAAKAVLLAAAVLVCASAPAKHHVELVESSRQWTTYADSALPRVADSVARVLRPGKGELNAAVRNGDNGHGRSSKFLLTLVDEPKRLDVRPAIEKAIYIMERAWTSKVPVRMRIQFKKFKRRNVLANGGGTLFCRIKTLFDELVPIAAGEAVLERDLNGDEDDKKKYDVLITINSEAAWYPGTDGHTPNNRYDLVTVLLHEIYHNLIFTGGIFVDKRSDDHQVARVNREFITRFDAFLANNDGCAILGYLDDDKLKRRTKLSGERLLANALVNDKLYFGFKGYGKLERLNAPRTFQPKSSIYHLDRRVNGDDALMSPQLKRGFSIHAIGPKILAIQELYLDHKVKGANTRCSRPLREPVPRRIRPEDRDGIKHNYPHDDPVPIDDRRVYKDGPVVITKIGHRNRFPVVWIVLLSLLAILLLITLCAVLACLAIKLSKKKRNTSISSSDIGGPGNNFPPPPNDADYRTPSRSKTSSFKPGPPYPEQGMGAIGSPSMGGPSMGGPSIGGPSMMGPPPPPPPIYPPTSSRHSSIRPPPPHPRPPSSSKRTSRSSSSRRPPSCKPPSRHHSSRAPKTVDYFDCS